ncbi:MAG TPA: hemolysin family protein [Sphingopyxis sp.]|nr:hemolysin family protein [Sphingopyxis sp.]
MADEQGHSNRSEEDSSRPGLLAGIKSLLFGDQVEPTLREQIEEVIDEAEDEEASDQRHQNNGDLSPIERKMMRNLLHFGEQTADDVAVPRGEIRAVPETASFDDLVSIFANAGHSRIPVYRESLDDVIGMILIKDVFAAMAEGRTSSAIADLIRQPLYVPQSMDALALLAEMRAKRTHLAIVIDEYSGTEGLVTFEDLVEEIVGEVEDEHDDEAEPLIVAIENGCWQVDARAELEDIGELIDPRLAEVDEDIDTIGGLSVVLANHVPEEGALLVHDSGWRIEVIEADERRVHRLRLHPPVEMDIEAASNSGSEEF